ncbi:MAG: hypothetical protein HC812_00355 [Leptolyngbya sp. RL_3_1]|nr:hypothetical protein [Leptolyngbya sp. RL_3_1]
MTRKSTDATLPTKPQGCVKLSMATFKVYGTIGIKECLAICTSSRSLIVVMFYYLLPATLTLGIVLEAFFRDLDETKANDQSLLLIGLVVLLWPITLPSILLHQYRKRQRKVQNVIKAPSESYV